MKLLIKDKEFPIEWGMAAIEMFCDALDCEIEDIDKAFKVGKEQIKYLTTLVECSLKSGADLDSYYSDFEVSYRDVQKFIDNAPSDTLTKIMEDFKNSKYFGKKMSEYLYGELEDKIADLESEGDAAKKPAKKK